MEIAKENLKERDVRLLLEFAWTHVGDFEAFLRQVDHSPACASRVLGVRALVRRLEERALA